MANETWPQGPSKKLQSIMDWLSNEEKKQMLELLSKEAWEEEINSELDSNLWEDFEKLDLGEKVDRIFEKLWDTDHAADLIIDLVTSPIEKYWDETTWSSQLTMEIQYSYKNKIMKAITWEVNGEISAKNEDRYFKIKDKFWSWPVALRLSLFMLDEFNGKYRDIGIEHAFYEDRNSEKNVTEKTLKAFQQWSDAAKLIAKNYLH